MKTKWLKRIRKNYMGYWTDKGKLIIIDRKNQRVKSYFSIREFLVDFVYDNVGINTGLNYVCRLKDRDRKRDYIQALIHKAFMDTKKAKSLNNTLPDQAFRF